MKKNGFTIIELLGVIVIMAVLLAIAVPSILAISNRLKTNMFCTKLEILENDARIFGEDYKEKLDNVGSGNYKNVSSSSSPGSLKPSQATKVSYITVGYLLDNGYLKSDKDLEITNNTIADPRDTSKSLNNYVIKVYVKYNRVYSKILDSTGSDIKDENGKVLCE